jgi:hypothetical protein
MVNRDINEGVRVLDELVCEAILDPSISLPGMTARGVNTGMAVELETSIGDLSVAIVRDRLKALQALSSVQLLDLVRQTGSDLSGEELLLIHDIAAERLAKGRDAFNEGSYDLSRETMLAALNRSA